MRTEAMGLVGTRELLVDLDAHTNDVISDPPWAGLDSSNLNSVAPGVQAIGEWEQLVTFLRWRFSLIQIGRIFSYCFEIFNIVLPLLNPIWYEHRLYSQIIFLPTFLGSWYVQCGLKKYFFLPPPKNKENKYASRKRWGDPNIEPEVLNWTTKS